MEASIKKYITSQPDEWKKLMTDIHVIIMWNDNTVVAAIEPMMGKEMILYKAKGMMKYGLAGTKKYMSLHVLPIYMAPVLSDKYKALLPDATFQKGCINFDSAKQMPLSIIKKLLKDCSKIDLVKIREDYLKQKKAASSKK